MSIEVVAPESVNVNPQQLDRITSWLQKYIDEGKAWGAVTLAARDGKVFYYNVQGEADHNTGRRLKQDDIFFMMSVSKCVCMTLVLKAIDEGRLSLRTKIADIMPEFAAMGKENVTVHQMMTHTIKLWPYLNPVPGASDLGNLEQTAKAACALEPMDTPGRSAGYQPYATYSVLGQCLVLIDEKKRSFRQIAKEELFDPLGMTDSSYSLDPKNPRRVPLDFTYQKDAPFCKMVNNWPETAEWPAGNVHSTAEDMFKLAEMYRNNGTYNGVRILSPAIVKYAMRVHTGNMGNDTMRVRNAAIGQNPDSTPMNYTLAGGYIRGEGIHPTACGELASPHSFTAIGGGSTSFTIDPERRLTVVCLKAGLIFGTNQPVFTGRLADLFISSLND